MPRLVITLDDQELFDREVKEVDVEQDIHGNLTASAKYEPITPDFPDLVTGTPITGLRLVTA